MTSTFKATYAGEAEGDIEAFGVTFPEGKSADVPERLRSKVEGNPFFKIGGTPAKSDKDDKPAKADDKQDDAKALKAEADAFNAMSDEEKAEYVKTKK